MKVEQNDRPMLFSETCLSDIFFTEYMPQANGDFVKVYLYIYFLAKYNKDIKLNDLSKKLALPLPVIQNALKYWEDQGAITKKNTGFIINDLQEIELHRLYKPRVALSCEDLEKSEQNQYRAKAIESINHSYFQGMMTPSWYSDITLWFKKYQFDEQVMIALFGYCFDKSALHRNYVQTVADAWSKNNIKTYNDLDIYFEKQERLNKIKKDISKKLGISRKLTQYEEAYVEKWIVEFEYSFDVIELALRKTTSKANPSFDYIDKLLCDWHDRNLKTVSDVETFLVSIKQKNKNIKELEKKTKYNNYEQRQYENLDAFYANKQNA